MFGAKGKSGSDAILAQLTARHGELLHPGEAFLGVCDAFGPSDPHPAPLSGRRATKTKRTNVDPEQIAEAHRRIASVRSALGLAPDDVIDELPASRNGYRLAHSNERLFVFDHTGASYKLQASTKGLWLQAVDHKNDMFTLIFRSGDDQVAVTTRRESVELTRSFIESFPDRRGQARVVVASDDSPLGFTF